MRKYIKTVREQTDNNSELFKEAKRRFHYEPSEHSHRYFLQQKPKDKHHNQKFKDDYSSVKDLKNEGNDVNESSWIAKLVNGIQEHSSEQARNKQAVAEHQPANVKDYLTEPVEAQPDNVVILTAKQPAPFKKHSNKVSVNNPTKKNSLAINKKQEIVVNHPDANRLKRQTSAETISTKHRSQIQRERTVSRVKNSSSLTRKSSQKVMPKTENNVQKQEGVSCPGKKKSLPNILPKKSAEQSMIKPHSQVDPKNNSKSIDKSSEKRPIHKNFINMQRRLSESINDMDEISCHTNKKDSFEEMKSKIDKILDDEVGESLFDQKESNSKDQAIVQSESKAEKRTVYGSIKKNKIVKTQQKTPTNTKSCNTFVGDSFKRDPENITFFNKLSIGEGMISERPVEEDDLVTARQEKILIDKYLRSDYSFKTHKVVPQVREFVKPAVKRQTKKYSYMLEDDNKERQNHLQLEIPTLRDKTCFSKSRQNSEKPISFSYNEGRDDFFSHAGSKYSTTQYESCIKSVDKSQDLNCRYNSNKQNATALATRKNSVSQVTTNNQESKCVNKTTRDIKPAHLSRQAYLQQSAQTFANDSIISIGQYDLIPSQSATKQSKLVVPSKYSYLSVNSALQQTDRTNKQRNLSQYQSMHKQSVQPSQPQSEIVIDRLNSKLTNYINHYQLNRVQEPEPNEWTEEQPTHRMMQLNFNQLKKHSEFSKKR